MFAVLEAVHMMYDMCWVLRSWYHTDWYRVRSDWCTETTVVTTFHYLNKKNKN